MPIIHKYQDFDFNNGFQTHNSILDVTPYQPEVLIIGTFNHGWQWNTSDFFYGRGMYMWPALANLFLYNNNQLINQRTINNDVPTQNQIFEICKRGKIVFADVVKGTNEQVNVIENNELHTILVNNEYTWETYKDAPLDYMGGMGWMNDNVDSIVEFVNNTLSIKHIYFTFKSGGWVVQLMNSIIAQIRNNVSACSIFTPTASGFRRNLPMPFQERVWSLTHCWVWNCLEHQVPIRKLGYGHLDHNWLIDNDVNPNNF